MSNNTLLVLLPIIPILGVVWYFALSGPSSTVDYKENTVAAVDKPVANHPKGLQLRLTMCLYWNHIFLIV